ncbi:hypothetical protein [Geodermatophilus maliterrae]|uniref:PAS domain-containing protein n=1 Tax=Geodermatophilus maliterrae TaxID=3162531 RepID=A0ABV3XA90_9ACTN
MDDAEQDLRHGDEARTALLDLAISVAGIGTFDWDLTTGVLSWDEQLLEMFGLAAEEFDGTIEAVMQCCPTTRPVRQERVTAPGCSQRRCGDPERAGPTSSDRQARCGTSAATLPAGDFAAEHAALSAGASPPPGDARQHPRTGLGHSWSLRNTS